MYFVLVVRADCRRLYRRVLRFIGKNPTVSRRRCIYDYRVVCVVIILFFFSTSKLLDRSLSEGSRNTRTFPVHFQRYSEFHHSLVRIPCKVDSCSPCVITKDGCSARSLDGLRYRTFPVFNFIRADGTRNRLLALHAGVRFKGVRHFKRLQRKYGF